MEQHHIPKSACRFTIRNTFLTINLHQSVISVDESLHGDVDIDV